MKRIILYTSLLSLPALAATESPQFFIGAKGGYQWASDDTYDHSDPNGAIWGAYGGLQFTPSWSWDLGYQYHDDLKADATSVNVKTWLIESALRYDWYLQDNLSVYGRGGLAYWDMEKTQRSQDKLDATGFSPLGEVGVRYNLTPHLSLSAGYQYIDSIGKSNTGKYDSHAALVSLAYTFGRKSQSALIETTPIVESISVLEQETAVTKSQPQTWAFSEKTIEGFFDVDDINPKDDLVQRLSEVAPVLKTHPKVRVVVVGHTDSTGTEMYNQMLSERRAQSVVNRLIGLGINPDKIEARGEGKLNPIADNATVEGRAANRRVEVIILGFQFEGAE